MKRSWLVLLLVLALPVLAAAQNWERQGDYYFLSKNRDNFSKPGAGPNKFASKFLKYDGVQFLVKGPASWEDYGRIDLEGNNMFTLPIAPGIKIQEVHLLTGGSYSNSYEHDKLMRLFGDKYFYGTYSLIFAYEEGWYREISVPIWWDWFRLGKGGQWLGQGAVVKSLGDNPVRKDCSMFHVIFTNPRPELPVKNILLLDSWVSDRPFSDIFALTVKSPDALDARQKWN